MSDSWQLKYLFIAMMRDGSLIEQTEEDRSIVDPLKSAFYDVVQRIDEVDAFILLGQGHTYLVDLHDGHFELDNVPFSIQPVEHPTIVPGGKFSLIYWRDHQHALTESGATHQIQYRIGWRYTDPKGREYIQTMVIA